MRRENRLNAPIAHMAFSSKVTFLPLRNQPLCPHLSTRAAFFFSLKFWKCLLTEARSAGIYSLPQNWTLPRPPNRAPSFHKLLISDLCHPFVSLESFLSSITQPRGSRHARRIHKWPRGAKPDSEYNMESGNIPAHVRQDSEGSVPLPPPQASQDPYGISQREGTGQDGTGWDGMGQDGTGWHGMGRDGTGRLRLRRRTQGHKDIS